MFHPAFLTCVPTAYTDPDMYSVNITMTALFVGVSDYYNNNLIFITYLQLELKANSSLSKIVMHVGYQLYLHRTTNRDND